MTDVYYICFDVHVVVHFISDYSVFMPVYIFVLTNSYAGIHLNYFYNILKMAFKQNILTFIVDDERIEVSKSQLAKKINYFAVMFMGSFRDSTLDEYTVQMSWTVRNIKDLIEWVNDDEDLCATTDYTKKSLQKFKNDDIEQLLGLLDIANYFIIDELHKDLKTIIIQYLLRPETAIYFSFYMRNQPFMKDVQDTAFAMCLEQFTNLPLDQIIELPQEHFLEIIGNVNLQCDDKDYTRYIMKRWYNYNCNKLNISKQYYDHLITVVLTEKRVVDKVQCFVVHKLDETNKKIVAFFWDGTQIYDIVLDLPLTFYPKEPLVGAQIVSRGFDMYLVGGTFGLESGKFNKDIWRFSFLTKQWYHVTCVKERRRHMSVIFWRTRLYLIGGVGHFRKKVDHMRYYDLETRSWSQKLAVTGYFNHIPCCCIVNDQIMLVRSSLYIYDSNFDRWETLILHSNANNITDGLQSLTAYESHMYCSAVKNDQGELWHCNITPFSCHLKIRFGISHRKMLFPCTIPAIVMNDKELIAFHYNDREIIVMTGYLYGREMSYASKYYYRRSIYGYKFGEKPVLGCFNITNPHSLYQRIPAFSKHVSRTNEFLNCNCSQDTMH